MGKDKIVNGSDVIKVRFKDNPFRFIIVEGEILEVEVDFNGELLSCDGCIAYDMGCTLRVIDTENDFDDISICNYIATGTLYADNIVIKKWVGHISLFIASYTVHNAECANGQLK